MRSSIATRGLVVLIAMLAGCAGESGGWTKPGMTQTELNRDTAECLNRSQELTPGRDGARMTIDQDRYRRCMHDLGYRTDAPR